MISTTIITARPRYQEKYLERSTTNSFQIIGNLAVPQLGYIDLNHTGKCNFELRQRRAGMLNFKW